MTTTARNTGTTANIEAITTALRRLSDGQPFEVRIPKTRRRTVSGYYDDPVKAARDAGGWSGQAPGVYWTVNPVRPELLARSANRLTEYAEHTTGDSDIAARRYLPIDIDPRRPAGISSSAAEHAAAIGCVARLARWLEALGAPAASIITADSGNGAHLLLRIDLPNDDAARLLTQQVLQALDLLFGDAVVGVDQTTFNASRIMKLYGTLAGKGDNTSDRPHRLARLLTIPDRIEPAPRELLEQIAAMSPSAAPAAERLHGQQSAGDFDLARWISDHQLQVARDAPWQDGGHKWVLAVCPWNPDHTDNAACIVQFKSGAIAARCHHNGCSGRTWQDLRELLDPREFRLHQTPPTPLPAAPLQSVPDSVFAPGIKFVTSFNSSSEFFSETLPFPVAALPPVARRLVEEGAQALGVPPDLIAAPLLGFAGAAIGNNQRILLKAGFEQYPTLYVAVVAPPGSVKSPALDLARWPLDVLQRGASERFKADLVRYEQDLARWKAADKKEPAPEPRRPVMEHFYSTDSTTEAVHSMLEQSAGFALIRDELVSWVNSFDIYRGGKGADRQNWLSLWAGAPLKVDRKTQDPIFIQHPATAVVGGIQPDMLRDLADEAGRRDGFIERILWAYPVITSARWTEETVQDSTKQAVTALFRQLRRSEPNPKPVELDPQAHGLWVAWFDQNAEITSEAKGLLQGVYAKLPNQAARLALILHCLTYPGDPTAQQLSGPTLAAALELTEYFRAMAHKTMQHFGVAATTQSGGLAARTLRILREAEGQWVAKSEMHDALARNVPAKDLDLALSELEGLGLAERKTVKPEGGRGRPSEFWRHPNEFNEVTNLIRPDGGPTEGPVPPPG